MLTADAYAEQRRIVRILEEAAEESLRLACTVDETILLTATIQKIYKDIASGYAPRANKDEVARSC